MVYYYKVYVYKTVQEDFIMEEIDNVNNVLKDAHHAIQPDVKLAQLDFIFKD